MIRRICFTNLILGLSVVLIGCISSQTFAQDAQEKITFDDHISPIFRAKCASCHNSEMRKGSLDVTNYTNLMQGGSSGVVLETGESDISTLFLLVNHEDEPKMPPKSDKIPENEIQLIAKWIDGGLLENKGSKAKVSTKPKLDMTISGDATARPADPVAPPRLVLEPVIQTVRATTVNAIATNPWAPIIAIGAPKQVLLYDANSYQFLGALPFPEGQPNVLKFSRSGSLLLAGGGRGGASGKVVIWNVKSGDRVAEVGDELETILAADISYDQSLVALGGPTKMIRVYSTQTGDLVYEVKKHTDWVTSIEFSPDGVLLATGDRSGGLFVWEGGNGREYLTLKGHTKSITGTSWRIDSNVLASSSEDTTIKLWELENGGQIKTWGAHGGGVTGLEFARNGNIVSCGRDRVAKYWDQNGAAIKQTPGMTDIVTSVSFCDETGRIIAGDLQGEIRVWNSADVAQLATLRQNPPSLQQRLDIAKAAKEKAQAEYAPLKAAADQANQELATIQSEMATAQAEQQSTKVKFDATNAALAQSKESLANITKQKNQIGLEFDNSNKAVALLKESSAKAAEAAKSLPSNPELQKSAAEVSAQVKTLDAQIVTLKTKVDEIGKQFADWTQKVAAQTQEMTTVQTEMNTVTNKVAQVQAAMAPIQAKATQMQTAANAVLPKAQAADAAFVHWQGEIAFRDRMVPLQKSLTEAEQILEQTASVAADANAKLKETQARLNIAQNLETAIRQKAELDKSRAEYDPLKAMADKAKNELVSVQTQMAAAQAERTSTQTKFDATNTALTQSKATLVNVTNQKNQLAADLKNSNAARPLLHESSVKAAEAAKNLPANQELQKLASNLVEQVKILDAQIAGLKPKIDENVKQLAEWTQKVAAQTQELMTHQTQLTAVKQKMTEVQAAMTPIQAKATQTEVAANAILPKLQAAEKEFSQWKADTALLDRIAVLQKEVADPATLAVQTTAAITEAAAQLKEVQAQFETASQQEVTARQKVDEIRQQIKNVRGGGT